MSVDRSLRRLVTTAWARIAFSPRLTWRQGYTLADLLADGLASLGTALLALPISLSVAVAVGAAPQQGLYAAIVAGVVTALVGGSPKQVTGPSAALLIVCAPVTAQFGVGGLAVASVLAGMWLMLWGLLRLGGLIRLLPIPVAAGVTGGMAMLIAMLQLKDFLGLRMGAAPDTFLPLCAAVLRALPTLQPADALMGVGTVAVLIVGRLCTRRLPASPCALGLACLACFFLKNNAAGLPVSTLHSRLNEFFGGTPDASSLQASLRPTWAWFTKGPHNTALSLNWPLLRALVPTSLVLAALVAIRSLLTARMADRLGNTRHNSDAELLGLGFGNILAPFFGGFIASGAMARTAANVGLGARSFVAAILQAGFMLASLAYVSPLLRYVPVASLAALLLHAACQLGALRHWPAFLRQTATADAGVFGVSLLGTLYFGAASGLVLGVVLAALLFCRAAAAQSHVQIATRHDPQSKMALPEYVWVCDVTGPLYFATVEACLAPLHQLAQQSGTAGGAVIIDLRRVPVLDASGVSGLKQAIQALGARHIFVVLVSPDPTDAVAAYTRAGWRQNIARSCTTVHRQEAIVLATRHVQR